MKEVWNDLPGYEGVYKVSNMGKVKSISRIIFKKTKDGRTVEVNLKGKNLKQSIAHMYLAVKIQGKTKYVHRLVMLAFVGKPRGLEVNHLDGNKLNNRLDNLEYVTHSENMKHAIHVLNSHVMPVMHGSENPRAKLNNKKVAEIRRRRETNSLNALAKEYGVSKKLILLVAQRKVWKHVE